MDTDEAQWLKAARHGDDDAFGRLIRPYLDPAYRLAVRILEHPTEAEDALQDALLRAWRALPRFRERSKFSTWFYRIVWNVCIDRTRRKEALLLEVVPTDVGPSSTPSLGQTESQIAEQPERHLEVRESQRELEKALRLLSVPYRTVLTLHYIEDLPIRDIAQILDLPLGTVKTHLHRARRALRDVLSNPVEDKKGGRK